MKDGLPTAAVLVDRDNPQCYTIATSGHAPFLIPKHVPGGILAGRADPGQPVLWQHTVLPLPSTVQSIFDSFQTADWWGLTLNDGSVRIGSSLDATEWMTIESAGTAPSYSSAGRGDFAVYPKWNAGLAKNVLMGWTKKSAATELLYAGGDQVLSVAQSDDAIAWLGVAGPDWLNGTYTGVRISWSPRARTGADLRPVMGPVLPITSGGLTLDTAGDWVGTDGCRQENGASAECRSVLVNRATMQAYFLKAPTGTAWTILAVGPNQVLLAESDVNSRDAPFMQRLTILDAASYAEWSQSL